MSSCAKVGFFSQQCQGQNPIDHIGRFNQCEEMIKKWPQKQFFRSLVDTKMEAGISKQAQADRASHHLAPNHRGFFMPSRIYTVVTKVGLLSLAKIANLVMSPVSRCPTSPEGWESLTTPQSDISRGPTTKGETRFRQVECVHECRRGLIGWPPHQADQKQNAKTNVFNFVRSLFAVPQPLQAAA